MEEPLITTLVWILGQTDFEKGHFYFHSGINVSSFWLKVILLRLKSNILEIQKRILERNLQKKALGQELFGLNLVSVECFGNSISKKRF
jgi:hypothetical protein